jgi:hypothetical protein
MKSSVVMAESRLVDRHKPDRRDWIIDISQRYSLIKKNYAIVARFTDPNTQQPTLIVAGLGENGTRAASEFIINTQTMHQIGSGWLTETRDKNFEVDLQTQLIKALTALPRWWLKKSGDFR